MTSRFVVFTTWTYGAKYYTSYSLLYLWIGLYGWVVLQDDLHFESELITEKETVAITMARTRQPHRRTDPKKEKDQIFTVKI